MIWVLVFWYWTAFRVSLNCSGLDLIRHLTGFVTQTWQPCVSYNSPYTSSSNHSVNHHGLCGSIYISYASPFLFILSFNLSGDRRIYIIKSDICRLQKSNSTLSQYDQFRRFYIYVRCTDCSSATVTSQQQPIAALAGLTLLSRGYHISLVSQLAAKSLTVQPQFTVLFLLKPCQDRTLLFVYCLLSPERKGQSPELVFVR